VTYLRVHRHHPKAFEQEGNLAFDVVLIGKLDATENIVDSTALLKGTNDRQVGEWFYN
jgi:hypothetical protein